MKGLSARLFNIKSERSGNSMRPQAGSTHTRKEKQMNKTALERFAHLIVLALGTAALVSAVAYGFTGYQAWEPIQWGGEFRGPALVGLHLVGILFWLLAMAAMSDTWGSDQEPAQDDDAEPTDGEVKQMREILKRRANVFTTDDEMREALREFFATPCDEPGQ